MPFVYNCSSALVATNFATHATPNTEIDAMYIKPGTRTTWLISMMVGGKGAGLTTISGIAYRLKKWPTTASAAGTAIVPIPKDDGAQAAKTVAGGASAGVTPGTGTAVFLGGCMSGAAGPGGWVAENPDAAPSLEASATKSIDMYSVSGTASLNYECNLSIQE
jgi:hypothetical protein